MHYLSDGPPDATRRLILAHGAGEGPESPFLTHVAQGLARGGVCVTRFAFPYMAEMAKGAPRRPPDPTPVLLAAWREVIADVLSRGVGSNGLAIGGKLGASPGAPSLPLVLGGKSLGGRLASLIVDEVGAAGLVCLGYPFHPPGRAAHAHPDLPGDPRPLRSAGRGRGLPPQPGDSSDLDRGRGP